MFCKQFCILSPKIALIKSYHKGGKRGVMSMVSRICDMGFSTVLARLTADKRLEPFLQKKNR